MLMNTRYISTPQNAQDFTASCGQPELALHLYCDDTILLERILKRGALAKHDSADMKTTSLNGNGHDVRTDDNIETALRRMRTYHKYHRPTMEVIFSLLFIFLLGLFVSVFP